MGAKAKTQIAIIKYNAVKLRGNYQIPLKLYLLIESMNKDTTESQVRYLVSCTERYLRVRNYWKKYHDEEILVNRIIENGYRSIK